MSLVEDKKERKSLLDLYNLALDIAVLDEEELDTLDMILAGDFKEIDKARKEIAEGKFFTLEELKKEIGI